MRECHLCQTQRPADGAGVEGKRRSRACSPPCGCPPRCTCCPDLPTCTPRCAPAAPAPRSAPGRSGSGTCCGEDSKRGRGRKKGRKGPSRSRRVRVLRSAAGRGCLLGPNCPWEGRQAGLQRRQPAHRCHPGSSGHSAGHRQGLGGIPYGPRVPHPQVLPYPPGSHRLVPKVGSLMGISTISLLLAITCPWWWWWTGECGGVEAQCHATGP